jgi:hypothetical protein
MVLSVHVDRVPVAGQSFMLQKGAFQAGHLMNGGAILQRFKAFLLLFQALKHRLFFISGA